MIGDSYGNIYAKVAHPSCSAYTIARTQSTIVDHNGAVLR